MNKITLDRIEKNRTVVKYCFTAEGEISRLFTGEDFVIDYNENIESVPDAVLAVPFVSNILPIIWLEDAEVSLPELDEDFYNSIPEFKNGFVKMYTGLSFLGNVVPERIVSCRPAESKGAVAFFSGGMDATTTLLHHIDEKPDLLSVWGSDVPYENADGWKVVQKAIDETAQIYGVHHVTLHSSLRKFYYEGELVKKYSPKMHESWWPGMQCGLALLGLAAPYVWLHQLKTVYFAASYSIYDKNILAGTDPSIDNFIRFCGAEVVHDGFEWCRSDKAERLVKYHQDNPDRPINLHVCWKKTDGSNCCSCEKCYRTMACIWSAGGDPKDYGMNFPDTAWKQMYTDIALKSDMLQADVSGEWNLTKQKMLKNNDLIRQKPYYQNIKWIESFDFEHPEKNWCRRWYNIRTLRGLRSFCHRVIRKISGKS